MDESRGLYRAFSEMDLIQIASLVKTCKDDPQYTKADLGQIEQKTAISVYDQETFFTIFGEQSQVYNQIFEQLKNQVKKSNLNNQTEEETLALDHYKRALGYVLQRPTPFSVKERSAD